MNRLIAAICIWGAQASGSFTPESAPRRAELSRRAATGASLGHSPLRVLTEFLADATAAKARMLRAHVAAGHLGTVLVNTSYGPLSGIGGGNATVNQFLGVPFAAPPTGSLRWRPPTPPTPWGPAPRDATWFAPTCMQEEWYWGALTGLSEDCLYADVYVPAAPAPPGGFPVMIFWYGGSWTYGGASFPLYDGETDVALMKDVILVAANYRLNVFGYLAGDELLAESADKSVGNYGFQDQRAVMTWVRDEIANFGGDPTQVTIFGESAGGGSVSNHLVSPRSRGLFARAAIESGSFASWTAQPYNISRTRLPQVARNLKCTGSGAPLLVCLRAVNETALLAADHDLTEAFLEWSPVIDGVEVLDDPRALAKAGAIAPVPVLLGFNADEGTLFNDSPTDLNATDYEAAIATDIGPVLAPEVVALYPLAQYESPWWAICAILRDSQMLCPGLDTARWVSTAPVPQSSFAYFYTQVLILTDFIDLFRNLRCFHGSELVSVFDFSVLLWNDEEVAMAKTFVGYWTNFARFGDPADPRGAPVPAWPVYASGAGQNVAVISAGDKVSANVTIVTGGLRGTECAFWDNVTIPPNTVWGPCNATTGCVPHASGLT